jgi:hypothetical protein
MGCSNSHTVLWYGSPSRAFYAMPGYNRDMEETPYRPKRSDVVLVLVFLLGCIAIAAVFW